MSARRGSSEPVRIGLEAGARWVFAAALDWPGWCRRGRGEEAAVEEVFAYRERYVAVVGAAFASEGFELVGRVAGNPTTDFGAPAAIGPWDLELLATDELERQLEVLWACWRAFDAVVASSSATLAKGPRGGGRDRDQIVAHVREAERSYASKSGVHVLPRTPWEEQRGVLDAAIRAVPPVGAWPPRYAMRRVAWHVLDHAWEIEDKRS